MNFLKDKSFLWFIAKFLALFCLFYFGTLAVIGLASPGKLYSPLVEQYMDYVSWIKQSLLWSAGIINGWAGYDTAVYSDYVIRIKQSGAGIKIAMDCVGYGVYSFWTAYVLANNGKWVRKLIWVTGGLLLLWLINSVRISLVLIFLHEKKPMPFGIDHHTWFNIIAYLLIFGMIWMFERSGKRG